MKAFLEFAGVRFQIAPMTQQAYSDSLGRPVGILEYTHWKDTNRYYEFSDFNTTQLRDGKILFIEEEGEPTGETFQKFEIEA